MKKRYWILTLVLMISLLLSAQSTLADEPLDSPSTSSVQGAPEYAYDLQQAIAALQARTPGAVLDYAVRERDDGRYEWDLFFTLNGQLGQCEIREDGFEVRRVTLYDMPQGGLKASEAMAALARAKGDLQIIDLELDRDDGRIRYEGEASLSERRYEFEISINGDIIEWERD